MFDIGFAELLIIAVLALVILGPERLPHAIRTVARWVHYIRQTANSVRDTVEKELQVDEIRKDLQLDDIKKELESVKKQATLASEEK